MDLSELSPPEGVENGGQVSPIFNFLPGQEISFEEKRAQDLNLLQPRKVIVSPKKRKLSNKSPNNQDRTDTSGVDEAEHSNKQVAGIEEQSLSTTTRNSRRRRGKSTTFKDVKPSSPCIKDRNVLENGDDLNLGQGVGEEEEGGSIGEVDQGESLQKSQEQGTLSVNGQEDEGVKESLDKMHDVVPSSEIDESDSSLHHHQRLSFPMLSEQQRKEDSPKRKRKVRRRKSSENGKRNSFKTPKVMAKAENSVSAACESHEDDNSGQKEGEEGGKEGEVVEHQVSKFLKDIRYKTRKAVGSPEPRRSSRIRQASTSSTEGGHIAPKRKEFGKTRMSLRMRTSSQK